jgi:hypothetical protein
MSDDLEKCGFCGLEVKAPCDEPPPVICQQAHDVLASHLLAHEQKRFEHAAYNRYLGQKALGLLTQEDGDGTPEALFWKQPSGEYGVLMFNAAWWGWRAAKGLL